LGCGGGYSQQRPYEQCFTEEEVLQVGDLACNEVFSIQGQALGSKALMWVSKLLLSPVSS
jgi:hypothetical protein